MIKSRMPNWCACSISIQGPEDAMAKFYQTLDKPDETGAKTVFAFHQTVPSANHEQMTSSFPFELPNVKNWGTKWDACEPTIVTREPTKFLVQCETAWSPPLIWGQKVAKLYPTLTFTIAYCERGIGFYGVWVCNQAQQESRTEEYHFLTDDVIHYRTQADGTRIVDDDNDESEPNGRLKAFMEKYSISHMGG